MIARPTKKATRKEGKVGKSAAKVDDFREKFETLCERALIKMTGRIRRYGNLFDMRHPRMIDGIRDALIRGTYEGREVGMIERHIKSDDRVLELGACIGATSLVLYDKVGRDALIVYEADLRNLEMAKNNFRINRKPVCCENAVLWSGPDRPDAITFSSNENPSSSSLIERAGTDQTVKVQTKDFDTALAEHSASVLVLDIEGGEIDLFAKAGDMPGLRMIMLEAHERVVGKEANEAMLAGLEKRGFNIIEDVGRKYIVLSRPDSMVT